MATVQLHRNGASARIACCEMYAEQFEENGNLDAALDYRLEAAHNYMNTNMEKANEQYKIAGDICERMAEKAGNPELAVVRLERAAGLYSVVSDIGKTEECCSRAVKILEGMQSTKPNDVANIKGRIKRIRDIAENIRG